MTEQPPGLVLYSKRDCHLCEVAKGVVRPLCDAVGVRLEEIDITDSPELLATYGEEVPVGYLNGEKVFKFRAHGGRVRRLLKKAVRAAHHD